MSIYSCHISNVSRAKGSSACATLSYISAEKVTEERTGKTYQYGRGERVLEVGTILPEGAPEEYQDAKNLFDAIESYETADNARTAKKIMVALPREFDRETQKEVIEQYIKENITSEGYACTYAIHTDADGHNPHAHILIANRQIDGNGKWSVKSRKEYALDENGERIPQLDAEGNQKLGKRNEKLWKRVSVRVNPLDKREKLEQLREQWAVKCNEHLASDRQIDHRSHVARGIEEAPTIHEGYAARRLEEKGGTSERCQQNREIMLLRHLRRQYERVRRWLDALTHRKQKEDTLNDRFNAIDRVRAGIARRKRAISPTIITGTVGNTDIESQRTSHIGSGRNHQRPAIRDYVTEAEQHKFDATEREIARISKEREAIARAKREAEDRKRAAEERERQLASASRKPTKTARESHDHTFTR